MIVGELTHDHEVVRNVKYESLWDNLGMSDIISNNVVTSAETSRLFFEPGTDGIAPIGNRCPDFFI